MNFFLALKSSMNLQFTSYSILLKLPQAADSEWFPSGSRKTQGD